VQVIRNEGTLLCTLITEVNFALTALLQTAREKCASSIWAVIVCWNCLDLNQYLLHAPAAERQAVADAIAAIHP